MHQGRIVEVGARDAIYDRPAHPYTRALLSAVPDIGPARQRVRLAPDPARRTNT
jgi:oligopeptide/dipeptide ABC transporter ATP-binding protein